MEFALVIVTAPDGICIKLPRCTHRKDSISMVNKALSISACAGLGILVMNSQDHIQSVSTVLTACSMVYT